MTCHQIINIIEKKYPIEKQEAWDSSGLLYYNKNKVDKILVCLDVTEKVAQYAIDNHYNLIISHHPLIFSSYNNSFEYIRMIYHKLVNHKINLYSMHTNFDNHDNGMNYQFIKLLNYKVDHDIGMLRTFNIDKDLYQQLDNSYLDNIKIYNKKDDIHKAAVCLGAGGSLIEQVKQLKADVFISSEFKHHEILYAQQHDITLIDVEHKAEVIFSFNIGDFLTNKLSDIIIDYYNDTYISQVYMLKK